VFPNSVQPFNKTFGHSQRWPWRWCSREFRLEPGRRALAMGATPCRCTPSHLVLPKSFSNSSLTPLPLTTTPSQSVSGFLSRLKRGDGRLSVRPVSAPGRESFQSPTEFPEVNSLDSSRNVPDHQVLRIRRLSSSGGAFGASTLVRTGIGGGISRWHSGGGCCKARLELRYLSLLFDAYQHAIFPILSNYVIRT
jgi:hypothetical protein